MSTKNRIDIVVGASPALAARVEAFRAKRAEQAGKPVTRTDVLRELIEKGLDILAEPEVVTTAPEVSIPAPSAPPKRETVSAGMKSSFGTAKPRFGSTEQE